MAMTLEERIAQNNARNVANMNASNQVRQNMMNPQTYSVAENRANMARVRQMNAEANKPDYYSYKDPITGKTVSIKPASQGGYMDAYAQYSADRNKQFKTARSNLKNTLAANNRNTTANYDASARQAYIDYMQKQKALPTQLAQLGVNGGASESGQMNLLTNYSNIRGANEQQRAAELATNKQNYDDALFNLKQERDSDLMEAYQTAYNNQQNEYNNERTRFSATVAQYPTTAKGYEKYEKWITRLKNGNDPLKKDKIAMIRQQMATQFPEGKPEEMNASGNGGGGGSRRSYGRRGGSGNGNSGDSGTEQKKGNSGNTRASYESRFKNAGKRSSTGTSKTKNIKGDTYYVTSKGSYRSKKK